MSRWSAKSYDDKPFTYEDMVEYRKEFLREVERLKKLPMSHPAWRTQRQTTPRDLKYLEARKKWLLPEDVDDLDFGSQLRESSPRAPRKP